jgi:DNA-binding protein YbaB
MPVSDEWILKAMDLPHEKLVQYTAQFLQNKARCTAFDGEAGTSTVTVAVRGKNGTTLLRSRRPKTKQ